MVTIRKTWQVASPARGGEIRGRAIDQAGYRVPGALVRLGPYSAITDAAGDYTFTRVPDGQFELTLDKDKLPAAYASDEKPRSLIVTRTSRERVDLQVIPLNAIRGRVCLDRDRNGYCDEDEGVPNVVVMVNGSVTATSGTGSYAFYNQPPGRYRIRLDVTRLPKGLAPASPAEIDIELTPDYPLLGIDFKVEQERHADHHAGDTSVSLFPCDRIAADANRRARHRGIGPSGCVRRSAGDRQHFGAIGDQFSGHRREPQHQRHAKRDDDQLFEREPDSRQGAPCERAGRMPQRLRRRVARAFRSRTCRGTTWERMGASDGTGS